MTNNKGFFLVPDIILAKTTDLVCICQALVGYRDPLVSMAPSEFVGLHHFQARWQKSSSDTLMYIENVCFRGSRKALSHLCAVTGFCWIDTCYSVLNIPGENFLPSLCRGEEKSSYMISQDCTTRHYQALKGQTNLFKNISHAGSNFHCLQTAGSASEFSLGLLVSLQPQQDISPIF